MPSELAPLVKAHADFFELVLVSALANDPDHAGTNLWIDLLKSPTRSSGLKRNARVGF